MTDYFEHPIPDALFGETFGPPVDPVVGDTWSGSLGQADDGFIDLGDAFSINVIAGQVYTFTVNLDRSDNGAFFVSTTTADGQTLVEAPLGDTSLEFTFTATETGVQEIGIISTASNALYNVALASVESPVLNGGSGNDELVGTAGDDEIYGGKGSDLISGGDGEDYIDGGRQSDEIYGGAQSDKIYGGVGNDLINGDEGEDLIFGGSGNDEILGGMDNDVIFGDHGKDKLSGGSGNDELFGGASNDRLSGNSGDDDLYGGKGNDKLSGGSGNDELYGGSQADELTGGSGSDLLDGGLGNDQLTGGADADVFVFAGVTNTDVITDFEVGVDRIDIFAYGPIAEFDVLAMISEVDGNAVVDFGQNGAVTLDGVAAADLNLNSFIYLPDDIFDVG